MDEKKLDELLSNIDVPEYNKHEQKRSISLAMEEFKAQNKKQSIIFQGFEALSRLMGDSNKNRRISPMEKKTKKRLAYSGLMTAATMALFAVPVIMTQTQQVEIASNSIDSPEEKIQVADVATPYLPTKKNKDDILDSSQNITRSMNNLKEFSNGDMQAVSQIHAPISQSQMKTKQGKLMIVEPVSDNDIGGIYYTDTGKDKFENFDLNSFKQVDIQPVSTFSTDVDTASYSFVRRQLQNGVLPQKDAVRIEEMINYFDYNYPLPENREQPFKPTVTTMDSPWNAGKKLMHIGIKGFDIEGEKPKSNLVFLLDVSGSMNAMDKLPLLVNSIKMLVDNLNEDDTVSIVVYAGAAGTVLEPTKAIEKNKIYTALDKLSAGGSTAGAAGINLAYQLAEENFDEHAVNRVILATDGDFNVGITNREELKDFVERKRNNGVYLSVFGFGQGNYNDQMMQTLAQNGNGVAAYIDTLSEARKLLVQESNASLFPIAKDVKIQVEFNPKVVSEYRLVGYETRALKREDFNNDKVDAGDIGAGHKVTAIYEYVPVGSAANSMDPLRYGNDKKSEKTVTTSNNTEVAFVKMRYKLPDENKSKLITMSVTNNNDIGDVYKANDDVAFSVAVAGFAQNLKGGKYTNALTYDDIIKLASDSKGDDEYGYRSEFIQLVRIAKNARDM